MIFATFNSGLDDAAGGVPIDPGFWVTLANAVMEFVIDLLEVDWTPIRVGVFLIVVGAIFDGGGAYLITSSGKPKRRTRR